MKALQLQDIGKLELIDTDVPTIAADELLVRTEAAVICTSDLNDLRENPFDIRLPQVIGHEGAGIVAKVGARAKGFAVGDRVATHPVHPCGKCAECRRGVGHLCPHMGHFGINLPGTFAEYFLVRADRARVVPKTVPATAAALAEPVCVCLEALAQAKLRAGDRLLIIGDGPFGIIMARLARSLDLKRTVIAGRHPFRLGFAADAVQINTREEKDVPAALRAETDGQGYDAAIATIGTAQAVREGVALLRRKGRLVIFGAAPGETPVDLFAVHVRELELIGACNDADRLDEAVARLEDPLLGLASLVTHNFPLADYRQAFDLAAHGKDTAIKVALRIGPS